MVDWDDICAFSTVRTVKVKNKWFGILQYSLMVLLIGFYAIGFVLVYNMSYLELEVPVGSISTNLKKPEKSTVDPRSFSYCLENPNATDDAQHCEVWDGLEVVFPTGMHNEMFVTTWVSEQMEMLVCSPRNKACYDAPWKPINEPNDVYIAGVTDYTVRELPLAISRLKQGVQIKIDHQWQALRFYEADPYDVYRGNSTSWNGKLVCVNEARCASITTNFEKGKSYFPAVGDINAAADITMKNKNPKGESRRRAGCTLLVTVNYNNKPLWSEFGLFKPNWRYEPSYTISVEVIGEDSKVEETIYLNATHRLYRNRHGVKMVFLQTGTIYKWSFQVAFVAFMTAFGLLGATSLIVERVVLHFRPQVEDVKVEPVADTNDLTTGLQAANSELASMRAPLLETGGKASDYKAVTTVDKQ